MMIWRFKPAGSSNFGDALNDYLWPKLLNPKFTQIPGIFYGIGTVLGAAMPAADRHVVFGAGVGYSGTPRITPVWKIYFVRGPHTAAALGQAGIDPPVPPPAITDPGILVKHFHRRRKQGDFISFMPRWDNVTPDLAYSCAAIGLHLIDPRNPVEQVISEIRDTNLLLTEALHGAVVADALRVPWISIYADRGHEFKWRDWCASMEMIWNPIDMAEFTLKWAVDNAVPQLSAKSVLEARYAEMLTALARFNVDLELM